MPSVHQSVFAKPEHEVKAFVRWQDEHANTPYAEVHVLVGDLHTTTFVDQVEAPKYAFAMYNLVKGLLRDDFAVWCQANTERACPLCWQPSDGGVHQECAEREAMGASSS